MAWVINWRGKRFAESDLLGAHLLLIAGAQQVDNWANVNPLGGPVKMIGVLAAFLALDGEGRPISECLAELSNASARELLDSLSLDDEPAPVGVPEQE